jgi:FMN phosphatase YigB (HAD superfamily)
VSVAQAFDVFDTCLTRTSSSPQAVFLLLGERVLSEVGQAKPGPDAIQAFAEARRDAERAARRARTREDIELAEIHAHWPGPMPLPAARMMALELETEASVLRPVEPVREWITSLRRVGCRILFVSDMYLPAAFIRDQLRRHRIATEEDRVYVSGEVGLTKATGNLYRHVLQQEGLLADALHMCGDHPHGDIAVPRRLGILARRCGVTTSTRYELPCATDWTGAFLAGIARTTRLRIEPAVEDSDPLAAVIGGVIAPLLVGYAAWVMDDAARRGIRRLYFVARDGALPLRASLALARHVPAPDCRYLYGSRKAWFLAGSADHAPGNLDWLFSRNESSSLPALLDKLDLSWNEALPWLKQHRLPMAPCDRDLQPPEVERFLAMIAACGPRALLRQRMAAVRQQADGYLRQEGLFDDLPMALVDVGWQARCQGALNQVLRAGGAPRPVHGYYLALRQPETLEMQAGRCRSLVSPASYQHPDGPLARAVHRNAALFEHVLFLPRHGSTLGYRRDADGRWQPVLGPWSPAPEHPGFLERLERAIDAYAAEAGRYLAAGGDPGTILDFASRAAETLALRPRRREACALGWVRVTNDLGGQRAGHLAPPIGLRLLARLVARKLRGRPAPPEFYLMWRAGAFAASPWYTRLPLRAAAALW